MFTITYSLLWIVVLAQALAILFLVRKLQEIHNSGGLESKHLPIGSMPPRFHAIEARSGAKVSSRDVLQKNSVLVMLSPDCSACRTMISGLSMLASATSSPLLVICQGRSNDCWKRIEALSLNLPVLIAEETDVIGAFQVRRMPAMVILEAGRIAAYEYPQNAEAVRKHLDARAQVVARTPDRLPAAQSMGS
jgi:hypothetical protein